MIWVSGLKMSYLKSMTLHWETVVWGDLRLASWIAWRHWIYLRGAMAFDIGMGFSSKKSWTDTR